jgi:hypothetical protein
MTPQMVIAAKNNIIAISFFKKTITVIWNDTGWGTRLGSSNSTSPNTTCLHHHLILSGMPKNTYSSARPSDETRELNDCFEWLSVNDFYFSEVVWASYRQWSGWTHHWQTATPSVLRYDMCVSRNFPTVTSPHPLPSAKQQAQRRNIRQER